MAFQGLSLRVFPSGSATGHILLASDSGTLTPVFRETHAASPKFAAVIAASA
jgi:hypothetical protein